jgi:hypothetical protein
LTATLRFLEESIKDFIYMTLGYPNDVQYSVCGLDLIDVIIRVDKRLHYFRVFHDMDINDGKKAALFAYWIVKFRPITIIATKYKNKTGYNDHVNELFAIHWLLMALSGMNRIKLKDENGGIELELEHPYLEELRYSLRFRNFTIDSMIVLADTITTETFTDPFSPLSIPLTSTV